MSSDLIKHVTDATFEDEVLKAQGPVLVDYWAEWCGPCKMIAPVLDDIASTYEGKLTVAKLNIDDNQETPAKHGVRGIPTLMLFRTATSRPPRWARCPNPSWPRSSTPTCDVKGPANAGFFRALDAEKASVTFGLALLLQCPLHAVAEASPIRISTRSCRHLAARLH